MSTKENKNVDIERYPLKSLNSIILRADGGDGGGGGNNNNNNNNTEEDEDEGRHSRHIQISAADSKSDRYRDEAELAHFGKRQQLKRCFGLISITGLTCTLMGTWEGLFVAFAAGLNNGGASGLLYGYIFAWAGTVTQVLIMAELGSMIPLSGGHYNWVAILSPPKCSKFLSYLTGWISVIAWQAAMASGAFLAGTIIQGLLVLNYPSTYTFQRWHGTLLFYAIASLGFFFNTYLVRLLPRIESSFLVIHILGFFGILIPLTYLAPHGSVTDVFQNFNNGGGWSTTALSFFVGLTTSLYAFIGIDAASHMAEEIENAAYIIPRSMIASVCVNGTLGIGMLIAILFCLGDLENALASPTGFPFIEIFTQATYSRAGGTLMTSLIIAAIIFGVIGCLATSSRMTWAFARERGLPWSSYLSRIHPASALPLWSIAFTMLINFLLALINIGSSTAFNAFTSLVVAAFHSSFIVSASVLLLKRLTSPSYDSIRWGPFKLGPIFGMIVNVLSIAYGLLAVFFSFWPATAVVDAKSMNWSVVVFGGVLLFSIFYWALVGRKVYTGPVVEVDNVD